MGARLLLRALVLAMAGFALQAARAADEVHEGKVMSVGDGTITVLDRRDDELDTFTVTAETRITKNGKPAKLSEIQPGDTAKVIAAAASGGKLIAKEIVAAAAM
jgi:hypothetical protein